MEVDRYTKFVLTIIAVGLWALVIKGVIAPQPAVAAAPTEEALQLSLSQLKSCLDGASISLNLSTRLTGNTYQLEGTTSGGGYLTLRQIGCL